MADATPPRSPASKPDAGGVFGYAKDRLSLLGILLIHLVADGIFCGLAAFFAYLLEHYVFHPLAVPGWEGYVVWAMRILTGAGLVLTVTTYIVADMIAVVRQAYRRQKGDTHVH